MNGNYRIERKKCQIVRGKVVRVKRNIERVYDPNELIKAWIGASVLFKTVELGKKIFNEREEQIL